MCALNFKGRKLINLICFFVIVILPNVLTAQNLINNPSFEDTIPDILYQGPPQLRPNFWFRPTTGSSDFFNSVPVGSGYGGGVPNNGFGFQYPRSGDAYLGFLVWAQPLPSNSREYIEGILLDSLEANHKYCLTFYVCLANNYLYGSDDIGAYFSNDSLVNYSIISNFNVTPQVSNPQGNILSDTLNWMIISGDFIAQGGEKFITIGNFKDDVNTTLDTNFGGFYDGSYYFIDDVTLVDCTVGIEEIYRLSFSLNPNPASDKLIIELDNYIPGDARLTIINIAGQLIWEQNYSSLIKPKEIDISGLTEGLYFLSLQTKAGYWVRKFIKQ